MKSFSFFACLLGILAGINGSENNNEPLFKDKLVFLIHLKENTISEKEECLGIPAVIPKKASDTIKGQLTYRTNGGYGSYSDVIYHCNPLCSPSSNASYTQSSETNRLAILLNEQPIKIDLKDDENIAGVRSHYLGYPKMPFFDIQRSDHSIISETQRDILKRLEKNDLNTLNDCLKKLDTCDFRDTFGLSESTRNSLFTFMLCLKDLERHIKQRIPRRMIDEHIVTPYLGNRQEVVEYKDQIRKIINHNIKILEQRK